jgi:glucose-1-phosphate adenylyltransferase
MIKNKKEIVAMILAGGQGARLGAITDNIAKPAVHFGGKYRIIDFALSNCSNSNIDTVGILTQYQPLALNTHIGIGSSWDLDTQSGGVKILPPYVDKTGERFFKGTANAIYENIHYVDTYEPEYVLILSGDHIYKMDYLKMLSFHKNKDANLTIAIIEVPWSEAHRFGILSANQDDEIREFYEKPENPVSNTASMGIYIFKWSVLKEELIKDAENPNSENDFGKDIIPQLVEGRKRVYGYNYKGYWKDVGTVESLWEANMDLLDPDNELNLHDKTWRNYSVNPMSPPQYISATGNVESSLVNEGCVIEGHVSQSIISTDVTIGVGSSVNHSVIMPNTTIEQDVYVDYAIVTSDITVKKGTRIVGTKEKIAVYAGEIKGESYE